MVPAVDSRRRDEAAHAGYYLTQRHENDEAKDIPGRFKTLARSYDIGRLIDL